MLQCQLAESDGGLSGNVAYLCCGEGEFPISRFSELVRLRTCKYTSAESIRFMEGLHIEKCLNLDDMVDSLVNILTVVLGRLQ